MGQVLTAKPLGDAQPPPQKTARQFRPPERLVCRPEFFPALLIRRRAANQDLARHLHAPSPALSPTAYGTVPEARADRMWQAQQPANGRGREAQAREPLGDERQVPAAPAEVVVNGARGLANHGATPRGTACRPDDATRAASLA